jgi:hypothetical protein
MSTWSLSTQWHRSPLISSTNVPLLLTAGNHYEILQTTYTSSAREVYSAYKKVAKIALKQSDRSTYVSIKKAYAVLSDPDDRLEYDKNLAFRVVCSVETHRALHLVMLMNALHATTTVQLCVARLASVAVAVAATAALLRCQMLLLLHRRAAAVTAVAAAAAAAALINCLLKLAVTPAAAVVAIAIVTHQVLLLLLIAATTAAAAAAAVTPAAVFYHC